MNKKVYIGNLPFNVQEEQLRELFQSEGKKVASVQIISDRDTGRSRGFGFVEMDTPEDAEAVIQSFNGRELMGRALVVNEAREQKRDNRGGGRSNGGGFGRRNHSGR